MCIENHVLPSQIYPLWGMFFSKMKISVCLLVWRTMPGIYSFDEEVDERKKDVLECLAPSIFDLFFLLKQAKINNCFTS